MPIDHIPNPEVAEHLRDLCKKGFFIRRYFSMWYGSSRYSGDTVEYSPTDELSFSLELKMLKISVNRFFFFNACQTDGGYYFIPGERIEKFLADVDKLRQEVFSQRDKIISNYDSIIEEVKNKYHKTLYWKWKYELKNEGSPPESYLENSSREYVNRFHTKSIIYKRFKLNIIPVNMFLDEKFSVFEDIDKINDEVWLKLYSGIITKRLFLLKTLTTKKRRFLGKGSGPFRSLVNFTNLYRNNVFYDDEIIVAKLKDLKDMIVKQPKRDKETAVAAIDDIIDYLRKDRRYFLPNAYEK